MKCFLGSPCGMESQSSLPPKRIEFNLPSCPLAWGLGLYFWDCLYPHHFPRRGLPKAEGARRDVGLPRPDASVLLAVRLPTASAMACQGSINFLFEESICTTQNGFVSAEENLVRPLL